MIARTAAVLGLEAGAVATLGPVASDDTWVQWWYRWDAPAGDRVLRVQQFGGRVVIDHRLSRTLGTGTPT